MWSFLRHQNILVFKRNAAISYFYHFMNLQLICLLRKSRNDIFSIFSCRRLISHVSGVLTQKFLCNLFLKRGLLIRLRHTVCIWSQMDRSQTSPNRRNKPTTAKQNRVESKRVFLSGTRGWAAAVCSKASASGNLCFEPDPVSSSLTDSYMFLRFDSTTTFSYDLFISFPLLLSA